jgi:hypothetical protein
MIKVIREFEPADRYTYDFGVCSYEHGFSQVDTDQDASYFGTWANPYTFRIFCYCEGDCILITCDTVEEFQAEMKKLKDWNTESGYSCAIDPGLDPSIKARWQEIGLGDLLH